MRDPRVEPQPGERHLEGSVDELLHVAYAKFVFINGQGPQECQTRLASYLKGERGVHRHALSRLHHAPYQGPRHGTHLLDLLLPSEGVSA